MGVGSVLPVLPSSSSRRSAPFSTAYPETEALPVLVVYAKRPFLVTTNQQAAVSVVGTEALMTSSVPSALML